MITEAHLVLAILDRSDLTSFVEAGLNRRWFGSKSVKEALDWIFDHHAKFGKVPTVDRFFEKFPEFPKNKPPKDSPQEMFADIKSAYLKRRITQSLAEVAGSDGTLNPEQMFSLLRERVLEIEEDHTPSKDVKFTSSDFVDAFVADLERRKNSGGLTGAPWLWETANRYTQGIQSDDLVVIAARTGVGKALAHGEPVQTPFGPKPIESLKVGDKVLGIDGKAHNVTGVFPQGERDIYRVTFTDGTHVDADYDHIWSVKDRRSSQDRRLVTTGDLLSSPLKDRAGHMFFVDMPEPAHFQSESELPIDPYTLGVLLGHCVGCRQIYLSKKHPQILENLVFPENHGLRETKDGRCAIVQRKAKTRALALTLAELGLTGTTTKTKFIPEIYKTASVEDRISLLQGFFDADGCPCQGGTVQVESSSETLMTDIAFVVSSLGGTFHFSKRIKGYSKNSGRDGLFTLYRGLVKLPDSFPCFRVSEKLEKMRRVRFPEPHRAVVSVSPVGRSQATCISVDAPDSLFLTRNFVPTHNTWVLLAQALHVWQNGYDVLFVSNELTAQTLAYRQVALLAGFNYSELRAGNVDLDEVRDRLLKALLGENKPQFIVTGNDDGMTVGGVAFVESKIRKHRGSNPMVVAIDGGYLLEDDLGGSDEYKRAGNVVRGLKTLQKRLGIPFLVSWQTNRQSSEKIGEASTKNLGLSDKVGQDSSYVLVLGQTQDEVLNREMKVNFVKTRESGKFTLPIHFDVEHQNFKQMGTFDSEPEDFSNDDLAEPEVVVGVDEGRGESTTELVLTSVTPSGQSWTEM